MSEVKSKITTSDVVVRTLNALRDCDSVAFRDVVAYRVPVNETIANHPNLIVSELRGKTMLGLTGLINGLLLACNQQRIASMHDGDDTVVGFCTYTSDPKAAVVTGALSAPLTGYVVTGILKDLQALDTAAFEDLMEARFAVNMPLPTGLRVSMTRGKTVFSILSLLNFILEELHQGRVAAVMDDGTIIDFHVIDPKPAAASEELVKKSA